MKLNKFNELYSTENQYLSLVKSEKFIRVENLSLDYMVQCDASFDDFRKEIFKFRKAFEESKKITLRDFSIWMKEIKSIKFKIKIPTVIENNKVDDLSINDTWLYKQINNLIKQSVALEIIPGLIIYKENEKYKLAFKNEVMEG